MVGAMVSARTLKVLAVEDDAELLRALGEALASPSTEFRGCGTVGEALRLLVDWTPDAVLLDVTLPDGTAFDVLDEIRRREPAPLVVAISGTATPPDAFRLAQCGVRAYLQKPFGMTDIRDAIRKAGREAPDLEPQLRSTVGRRSLRAVESGVRERLVREALARSGGSRSAAARLLEISRQHLQNILRRKPKK
jgi:DNA-binding NtrC family response regulator